MKHVICFFTALMMVLLCSSTIQAQEESSRLKAGITLGYNTNTNIAFTSGSDGLYVWEPRKTLSLGASGSYQFNDNWSFQSGAILTERGTTYRPFLELDESIWMLEIPMHVRYERSLSDWVPFLDDFGVKTYGFAGLYLGYGLASRVKSENTWAKLSFGEEGLHNKQDLGISFGVGAIINVGAFSGEIKYKRSRGLKDISPDTELRKYITNDNISITYYLFR